MTPKPRMEFGYNPPTGARDMEVIRPREFLSDLDRALDVATQGFGSIWVSDHLNYSDEFRVECWTLLTWIAARYPGVDLSTIVMSNSFRNPSLMAKMGASLQHLTSGRFILGYGAGWYEPEYTAYGFDFPSFRTRLEMLEEGVQVIRALWTETPANFTGKHYSIREAYGTPLPEATPPIMLGGAGEKYTLGVVARQGGLVERPGAPAGRDAAQGGGAQAALRGERTRLRQPAQDDHRAGVHRPLPLQGQADGGGVDKGRAAAHCGRPGRRPRSHRGARRRRVRPVHRRAAPVPGA